MNHLTVLRTLDPANADVSAHSVRARADLARILATEPPLPLPPSPSPVRPRRRLVLRAATGAAAAAAVVTGTVLVPSLTGGDEAFATWTGTPAAPSAGERSELADACRAWLGNDSPEYAADLARADIVVAERRGMGSLAYLVGDDNFTAMCVTDDSQPFVMDSAGFTDATGGVGNHRSPAPGPREVSVRELGTAGLETGDLSVAAGAVGTDVVGLTYSSAEHGTVTATVTVGHFAFWLPGDELEFAPDHGIEVTVTYRDGSTGSLVIGKTR